MGWTDCGPSKDGEYFFSTYGVNPNSKKREILPNFLSGKEALGNIYEAALVLKNKSEVKYQKYLFKTRQLCDGLNQPQDATPEQRVEAFIYAIDN